MAAQHFFVGSAYLGHRQIPDTRIIPGLEVRLHYSRVYFCARCGELWGRLLHDKAKLTQCVIRPCAEHGDGRLSDAYPCGEPTDLGPDWPAAALRHELLASIALAERELAGADIVASPGVIFSEKELHSAPKQVS